MGAMTLNVVGDLTPPSFGLKCDSLRLKQNKQIAELDKNHFLQSGVCLSVTSDQDKGNLQGIAFSNVVSILFKIYSHSHAFFENQ